MPPTNPEPETVAPATPPADTPPPQKNRAWSHLAARANTISGVITLFAGLLILGGAAGYGLSLLRAPSQTNKTTIQTLSEEDLRKLTDISANLGNSNQVLNIGANALFRGKADISGDLSVGGRFNANGPVTLSQLNITGTSALAGLNVGSNLIVAGTTTLQKGLTVSGLTAITGGLNVTGAVSASSLNTTSISVQNITINGPLVIGHLRTQGTTPTAAGANLGSGGTANISGNDTAGRINITLGSNASTSATLTRLTVTFRAAYSTTPRILLSPLSQYGATAAAYVVATGSNFQVRFADLTTQHRGETLSFDYFVTQ